MRNRECNGANQPAGARGPDGRLHFPTIEGVVSVDPSGLVRNPVPPPVRVEEVRVDGVPAPARAFLELPPGVERFEFQYTALSFRVPSRVVFRVRLEGVDREWVDVGTRRSAYYTHLPPGPYTFRVAGRQRERRLEREGGLLRVPAPPAPRPETSLLAPHRGVRARDRLDRLPLPGRAARGARAGARGDRRREDPEPARGEGADRTGPRGGRAAARAGRGGREGRRRREPDEERLPRRHEPRAPDAAQRHPRLQRDALRGDRRTPLRGPRGRRREDPRRRAPPPRPHQRPPRPLQDGGGKARPLPGRARRRVPRPGRRRDGGTRWPSGTGTGSSSRGPTRPVSSSPTRPGSGRSSSTSSATP